MPVDGVRAEHEPFGDLRVAQPLGHEAEHLALPFAQLADSLRQSFPSRLRHAQESGHGSDRIGHVPVPRKVRVPRDGDEVGARDEAGDLLAGRTGIARSRSRWTTSVGTFIAESVSRTS